MKVLARIMERHSFFLCCFELHLLVSFSFVLVLLVGWLVGWSRFFLSFLWVLFVGMMIEGLFVIAVVVVVCREERGSSLSVIVKQLLVGGLCKKFLFFPSRVVKSGNLGEEKKKWKNRNKEWRIESNRIESNWIESANATHFNNELCLSSPGETLNRFDDLFPPSHTFYPTDL